MGCGEILLFLFHRCCFTFFSHPPSDCPPQTTNDQSSLPPPPSSDLPWMAGTSEAGTSRSTVNTPVGFAYDVFVSFRGPDTRNDITDVLYEFMREKGICVFRDTEEVRNGEAIGDELRRAVPDSRIYVVVFSKGYASSAWCLRELALMAGCCRDTASRKVILPIFYDVSPDDVKLQTDLYRDAVEKHKEKKYKEEDVKLWEEALEEVGRIRGMEYKESIGKGKFVSDVVKDILNKLKIKDRRLPDQLLGMDDRVKNVMGMLNLSSHVEPQVVMVHGMGGIGKTTLANVIFNRISSRFDGCCFLPDVRETFSTGVEGVERLQKKLLRDIFGKSDGEIGDSSDGMNEIQRRLGNRRVLIIFDDVSESSQLIKLVGNFDFFGPGTKIIITTRDKSVCKGLMKPSDTVYEVEGMSDDHALQLFSQHAFRGEGPPNDFVDLSKRIIRMSGNLPLALEVIGGLLSGKEKNEWEHTLEKLDRVPNKDILKKLRISYDDLDESEKQIFLDIACFDHRVMPRKYVSYMWEACGFFPKSGLDVLQNRSLIKVLNVDDHDIWTPKEKYWMHDLIREMGREIVSSESPHLCKRSRLWDPELAFNVIRQKQGTDKVLAIHLNGILKLLTGKKLILSGKEFEGMSNIRFLSLIGEGLSGAGLSGEFRNLLWLRWDVMSYVRPNPYIFQMDSSLVILQISGHEITDDSTKDMRMGNLRVLDISEARITRLPDLSLFPKLEIIDIRFCWELKEIHSSIGVLGDLKRLNIKGCSKLTRLPEELGYAKALQELILFGCNGVSELPESIGRLGDLRILRGIWTQIRKLPSSIGNLKSLEVLEIEGSLDSVGISMSEEPNLARCNLSGLASLRSLMLVGFYEGLEGIENLYGLQKLKLDVGGIPSTNLGSMSRLDDLYLHSRNISSALQLPSDLRKLTIMGCSQIMWSETLLDGRDINGNMSYRIRLSDLGSLSRLCSLTLLKCDCIDFSGVEKMELLEELSVSQCGDFVGKIADLSNLRRLKRVEFQSCNSLISVPCMAGDCHLKISSCGKLQSFEGPYRRFHNKKKGGELEVE